MSENQEKTAPTKEEIITFMKEQIEVKTVQLELQRLNTAMAVERMEELKALSIISQITNPSSGQTYAGGTPHTVTQEDMDNNPELADQGIKVGDEVLIPSDAPSDLENVKEQNKRSLKTK